MTELSGFCGMLKISSVESCGILFYSTLRDESRGTVGFSISGWINEKIVGTFRDKSIDS